MLRHDGHGPPSHPHTLDSMGLQGMTVLKLVAFGSHIRYAEKLWVLLSITNVSYTCSYCWMAVVKDSSNQIIFKPPPKNIRNQKKRETKIIVIHGSGIFFAKPPLFFVFFPTCVEFFSEVWMVASMYQTNHR